MILWHSFVDTPVPNKVVVWDRMVGLWRTLDWSLRRGDWTLGVIIVEHIGAWGFDGAAEEDINKITNRLILSFTVHSRKLCYLTCIMPSKIM